MRGHQINPSQLMIKGALDTLPLIIAMIPFAILYGALAIANGLSFSAALGMSIFVFAGASQFVAASLFGEGVPVLMIIITVFMVNLRHMLYSIAMMASISDLPVWQRIPMGFCMTDESFATVSQYKIKNKPTEKQLHYYFWGSAFFMYFCWVGFSYVGIVLGESIPDMTQWGLDIAMVLAFVAIVVPALKHQAHWCCVLVAGIGAIVTFHWPYKMGLLFSSLLAIVIGVTIEVFMCVEENE